MLQERSPETGAQFPLIALSLILRLQNRSFRAPVPNAETATKLKGFDAAGMRCMDGTSPQLSTFPRKVSIAKQTIHEEEDGADFDFSDEPQNGDSTRSGAPQHSPLPQMKSASHIYLMGSAGDVDWTSVTREDEALAQVVTESLLRYYDVRYQLDDAKIAARCLLFHSTARSNRVRAELASRGRPSTLGLVDLHRSRFR